ncbi:MAG: hypothetical protein PHW24_03120 [Candidatus Moranbacteria bacterium]|nr:hypothetical protein [Candidatus Moranbacteria bacterium]
MKKLANWWMMVVFVIVVGFIACVAFGSGPAFVRDAVFSLKEGDWQQLGTGQVAFCIMTFAALAAVVCFALPRIRSWMFGPLVVVTMFTTYAVGTGLVLARGVFSSFRLENWQRLCWWETLLFAGALFVSASLVVYGINWFFRRKEKVQKSNFRQYAAFQENKKHPQENKRMFQDVRHNDCPGCLASV